jgi:hypothetical protein
VTRSFFVTACIALAGTALAYLAADVADAQSVQAGVLRCNVAPGVGVVIGSSKDVACVFHPVRGKPEYYAGRISRFGVDVGVTGPAQFSWGVFTPAPPGRLGRWQLAGEYGGPGIGLAVGVAGGSADSLVGGVNNAISQVPISGTTQALVLSAGVGALSLQPSYIPPRPVPHPI